jgi:ribosomal-protein-alanine N-acetyltransferase
MAADAVRGHGLEALGQRSRLAAITRSTSDNAYRPVAGHDRAVYLRQLEVGDAQTLLDVLLRDRAFLDRWEPVRKDTFFTLETQQRGLARLREAEDFADFGIFIEDGDELVGRLQLSGISPSPFENAYLGYFVSEQHNGRGYATEAVRQAVDAAFGELDLHRVQAAVIPRNVASVRVLEKAGFRHEGLALRYLQIAGVWEDHLLYAVTAEEWPSA